MKNKGTMQGNFKRLVKIIPNKGLLIVAIILIVWQSISKIIFSHFLREFIDTALARDIKGFMSVVYLMSGVMIVEIITVYVRRKASGKYSEKGVAILRTMTAKRLAQLPVAELEAKHSGDYISRMTNDINRVREFIVTTIFYLIYYPLTSIGALLYLSILNWKLTLVTSCVTPLILLTASLLSKPITKYMKQRQEQLGIVNSLAQDSISGIEVARSFGLHKCLEEKYSDAVALSVKSAKAVAKRNGIMRGFSEVLNFVPFIICFVIGGYWAINGEMTPGSLLAFINLLNNLTFPVSMLPEIIGRTRGDMVAAERVFEILDHSLERETGKSFEITEGGQVIQFIDVDFAYVDQLVLNKLSLEINHGEMVALVGPSGGGKSTIVKLIQGYYDNYRGQINLFAKSMQEWNLSAVREHMALVAQDIYLFPGTIKENIGYGNPDASEDEIIAAAKAANAHQFITELNNGYETRVGELGGKLSGGEKQRLSIARAILKNAPLLLLDEATSALDTGSEMLVQQALDKFMKDRTTVVIAHRLSTIRNADRVLVIDQGKIVEVGIHEELLEKGGLYSQLYLRQLENEQRTAKREVV